MHTNEYSSNLFKGNGKDFYIKNLKLPKKILAKNEIKSAYIRIYITHGHANKHLIASKPFQTHLKHSFTTLLRETDFQAEPKSYIMQNLTYHILQSHVLLIPQKATQSAIKKQSLNRDK